VEIQKIKQMAMDKLVEEGKLPSG
jgi:hypothetical protein